MKVTQNNIFHFDKIIDAIVKYVLVITHSTNIQTLKVNIVLVWSTLVFKSNNPLTPPPQILLKYVILVNKALD